MYLFNIFHQLSKEFRSHVIQPTPKSSWPDEWKTTYFKVYERFPSYVLPAPARDSLPLFDTIRTRVSDRTFGHTVNKTHLSDMLHYGLGERDATAREGAGFRMYASGGARYPLEAYICLQKPVDDLPVGVYHYGVYDHSLTLIYKRDIDEALRTSMVAYDFLSQACGFVILTGVMQRSSAKYKEHAYRYALLEAGGVTEQMAVVATAIGIGTISIGVLSSDVVEELLDIDGTDEIYLHAFFFG